MVGVEGLALPAGEPASVVIEGALPEELPRGRSSAKTLLALVWCSSQGKIRLGRSEVGGVGGTGYDTFLGGSGYLNGGW